MCEIAVAILVDGAQVGRVRIGHGARDVIGGRGARDQLPPRRELLRIEQEGRQRPVEDVAARVCERELHRLDLRVQPADGILALEPVVDAERHERGAAGAVRRNLADLEAAVGEAHGLDPLAAMRREVLEHRARWRPRWPRPPGPRRDRAALARRSAGACGRGREACRAARLPAAARATSLARARAASGGPRARPPRRRSRPGRWRGRARGRARACRSAARGRPRRARHPAWCTSAARTPRRPAPACASASGRSR